MIEERDNNMNINKSDNNNKSGVLMVNSNTLGRDDYLNVNNNFKMVKMSMSQ